MKIDMHVHLVGNGSSGSGCWLRPHGIHKYLYNYMLKQLGLPAGSLERDLDELFLQKLLQDLESSSMDSAAILAMDNVYDKHGKVLEGQGVFYIPNEHVLKLAKQYPQFIPAVSIHPDRPDAMDELEKCLDQGAAMMKLLPNVHGVNCNDRRYEKFWKRMAEARLPFLPHTGSEHTLPVLNKAAENPQSLELPLECGVTIIAAHSAAKNAPWDEDGLSVLFQMMEKYPNLYGDTSAFNLPWRCRGYQRILKSDFRERFIHGSDYPVPVQATWPKIWGLIDGETRRTISAIPNSMERDYQIKKAIGFEDAHFTRGEKLLRKSH
ncbi:MAG: amidohydrolase family protein [Verrucomicrobiota bacterium]